MKNWGTVERDEHGDMMENQLRDRKDVTGGETGQARIYGVRGDGERHCTGGEVCIWRLGLLASGDT